MEHTLNLRIMRDGPIKTSHCQDTKIQRTDEENQRCFLLQGPDSSEEKSVSVILVTYTPEQNTSQLQEI